MDQILKTRKLSSASARRKKFQERQQQQALDREKLAEHKRRILMYDHMAEHVSEPTDGPDEENSADEIDMDAERFDRDSSVETPSERSILTPDEMAQNRATFGKQTSPGPDQMAGLKIQIPDEEEVLQQMEVDKVRVVVPPSPKPLLQASLASWSDFRYDRYSAVLDSPLSEVLSPESENEDTFSPIETATPISYQQPKSRPSLISIVSLSHRGKRRTASMQSPLSLTVPQTPERPSKRQSMSSVHSGFPAAEATRFEVPSLPENAFELIANASQESLPLSTKEPSRSKADRKSSMPRLSTALSHARMSSIKSFIKTPTTATTPLPHTRSSSRPSSHVSRPSTASTLAADAYSVMKNPAASTSSNNLSSITRPLTSQNASASMVGPISSNMTALPSLPTPPADEEASDPLANRPAMQRKKSFSALRRRSESIGQAIKGLGKITTKHDVPVPMNPGLMTPKKPQPFDLSQFPTPPLPSPRTGKSSAGSFTSTRATSSGGHIGLGLRSVEGFAQR
ncbi:uncharacterized protein Z520_05022 [Fonsecaea multimorphosa CBS 102226]|uniref:Uncharacterized protein n=1 Tax=Fonsecaea multimorphosa CBS 102226 TaxID=1442371 RepID=A0A0D2IR44_9EURO|nr:uncharacterized protein Z520_05022 [Fonsecaea multimorphosa CBS 102226]KIX99446.1 hypothetical protein Z520_05022 [Fonsecaea multimorphosa CBS 102226]OAL25771.1 hypothetical protein AYO22_04760 [Fonsecaea multimorphosa]